VAFARQRNISGALLLLVIGEKSETATPGAGFGKG